MAPNDSHNPAFEISEVPPPEPELLRRAVPLEPFLNSDARPVVGILGGSFSPPHRGHQQIAEIALEHAGIQALLVIPAFHHAFGKELAPYAHRLAMARIAFHHLAPRVIVSSIERLLPRPSYTVATLRALDQAWNGRVDWRLIVGSDVAADLPLWREPETLLRLAPPRVLNRMGADHQLAATDPRVLCGGRPVVSEISSSAIRDALAAGNTATLQDAIPQSVLDYIRLHRLQSQLGGTTPAPRSP